MSLEGELCVRVPVNAPDESSSDEEAGVLRESLRAATEEVEEADYGTGDHEEPEAGDSEPGDLDAVAAEALAWLLYSSPSPRDS